MIRVHPKACGKLCPEASAWMNGLHARCKRLHGHEPPHRSHSREWNDRDKESRPRTYQQKSRAKSHG